MLGPRIMDEVYEEVMEEGDNVCGVHGAEGEGCENA